MAALAAAIAVLAVAALPVAIAASYTEAASHNHERTVTTTLSRTPEVFHVAVSPSLVADPATRSGALREIMGDIDRQVIARSRSQSRAGFVLVFASGPITQIERSIGAARSVFSYLQQRDSTFRDASGVGYWGGGASGFAIKVYFFITKVRISKP
jgi:hypothetical protein